MIVAKNIENLAFSGAGVKGVAYAGAYQALEELGIEKNIKRVAGSSVGSMASVLIALGYNAQKCADIMMQIDMNSFIQEDMIHRLENIYHGGLHSGESIKNWVKQHLQDVTGNPDLTFGDLISIRDEEINKNGSSNIKELYITSCDIHSKTVRVFSHNNAPNMKIACAVRMSAGFPGFFVPYLNELDGHLYIDGGAELNNPARIFDNGYFIYGIKSEEPIINERTLGFVIVDDGFDPSEKRKNSINKMAFQDLPKYEKIPALSYMGIVESIYDLAVGNPQQDDLISQISRYVCIPNQGVTTLEFSIDAAKKKSLIGSGYMHTMEFLNKAAI